MENRMLLKQSRLGISRQIEQSPTIITISRTAMIDDGFEGQIPDPSGTPDVHQVTCRISHERQGIQTTQTQPVGLDTALTKWILVDWTKDIQEGDVFTAGRQFRIGVVDALAKFGGIIAYQAPLYPAGTIGTGEEAGS